VDRAVVVALVHDRDARIKAALAHRVDEPEREVRLGGAGRLNGPREGRPVTTQTAAWTL